MRKDLKIDNDRMKINRKSIMGGKVFLQRLSLIYIVIFSKMGAGLKRPIFCNLFILDFSSHRR